ncbi:Response regulator receiver domain protein [Novipirellula aureliae]|uniref:Response regulator receiver domain protein n=1 Tax=Novipirellula aureliae TaxID=2527966 RepID=A0A5C6DZ68_9BACT|nr:response regulator [Novipirellula aureliae]TWU40366.1 Response regulator receiver domain protein [Novipirellula aureliae]
MPKLLVDCGNCGPDFQSIRRMASSHFKASVIQTHGFDDTVEALRKHKVDLVTINRKLDRDYSDGLEILAKIKGDPAFKEVPVMLVTNYDEHQQSAIEAGGVRGFGKLSMNDEVTRKLLEPYLSEKSAVESDMAEKMQNANR